MYVEKKISTQQTKTGSQPEVGLPRVTREAERKRTSCRAVAVLENFIGRLSCLIASPLSVHSWTLV